MVRGDSLPIHNLHTHYSLVSVRLPQRAWVNYKAMFYKTFICFYVLSEAKPLCFRLCSQMFDDAERC